MKITKFDVVDYLDSVEMIEAYLKAVREENDEAFFKKAIRAVEQAKRLNNLVINKSSTKE